MESSFKFEFFWERSWRCLENIWLFLEWDSEYPLLEGTKSDTDIEDAFVDATAAKWAAISGVCICGYLEVTPMLSLSFDCFGRDWSEVDAEGGEEELVVVKFWVDLVFDVDELRWDTEKKWFRYQKFNKDEK